MTHDSACSCQESSCGNCWLHGGDDQCFCVCEPVTHGDLRTHDPLCPFAPCDCYKDGSGLHSCGTSACQCHLIAKVRADTLDKARQAVAANEMGGEHVWCVGFRDGIAVALIEIDDLRAES